MTQPTPMDYDNAGTRNEGRPETASRVSWMDDWQRDPTRYFRERFAAVTAQSARECEQAARDKRERGLVLEYAARREPQEPNNAA